MIKRGADYNSVDLGMDPSVDRRSAVGKYNIVDGLPRYEYVQVVVFMEMVM